MNNYAAEFITRDLNWFASERLDPEHLPSDNWRIVSDNEGRTGILYLVLYYAEFASGEPKRVPNEPDALPTLHALHQSLPLSQVGPFIALAEMSTLNDKPHLHNVRIWNIGTQLAPDVAAFSVAELGKPLKEWPRIGIQGDAT
jgi:hypothetical protein